MALTPLQQLVDLKLGIGLPAFLSYCRTVEMTTRDIAVEIQRRTGVIISHETARVWLNDLTN